ncbi:ABC-type transporter, substrate-binding protein [Desulforapulum autotrophicum HRM2]|uniref:ABC-type transporter, substrate-binding protein n=1 Tax=Desulforapulum autotrophicum (strain ATCC 43914 / DSM 3382 / VKM B-1955 / HRM2) TaxID=177437 RepID=C0QGJ9_DESAH|nr:ABC-type transporter, substrate-binding protein [Desulforapulum autotrophicum HRM2]
MTSLASLFDSDIIFFTPFIYVFFYLFMEKNFNQHPVVKNLLKIFTVFFGIFMIIYTCTTPPDFMVLMPSRGGWSKSYLSASIFLIIVGAATMALPLYSKYIKFSNRNE